MKNHFCALFAFIVFSTSSLFAQENDSAHKHGPWCGHDQVMDDLRRNNPDVEQNLQYVEDVIAAYVDKIPMKRDGEESDNVYRIPVVFHIMYADERDNISRHQIMDAIRVLNEDFRRKNADSINTRQIFQSRAADSRIEFHLARVDPNGNCTSGINRIETPEAAASSNNIKNLSMWDNSKYLNIWVVRTIGMSNPLGTVLGYAYFPQPNQSGLQDGIVIRHDRVGTIGTSGSAGRTLTHEVGHYLALHHPFNNGCTGGDQVNDTPPVAEPSFGCNLFANTCTNDVPDLPDMIENYMDYANDNCQNIFTIGQRTRMHGVLDNPNLRGDVSSNSNLSSTGVVNGNQCAPISDFFAQNKVICAGDTVKFVDASVGANPTSYQWSFPGGTPSTSSERYPNVVYASEGDYDVTLTVSNGAGSVTMTKQFLISVNPEVTPFDAWLQEDFETHFIPNANWRAQRLGDQDVKYEVTNDAAFTGEKSLKLNHHNSEVHGKYRLISPPINLARAEAAILEFKIAFAPKEADFFDRMNLRFSQDCGKTWFTRRTLSGPFIQTAPPTGSTPFVPQSQSEWNVISQNLGLYAGSEDELMIMWEFEGRGGSNFYIDDIDIQVTLSNDNFSKAEGSSKLYPNPSNGDLFFSYNSRQSGTVNLHILDMNGKRVSRDHSFELQGGSIIEERIPEFLHLAAGVYLVHIQGPDGMEIRKVIRE